MKIKIRQILLIFVIIFLSSCKQSSTENVSNYTKYNRVFLNTFDTAVTVIFYAESKSDFDIFADIVENRFIELTQLYDIYNDYDGLNNIKTINDNAGIKPVKVSKDIIDMISFSKDWYKKSNGRLNIALGPVLNVWHTYRDIASAENETNDIPTLEELKIASVNTNIDDIEIDFENNTIFLKTKGMILDVGAVAKGYASELVSSELKEKGYKSFAISAGGNVLVTGNPPDKTSWTIGIQSPDDNMTANTSDGILEKVFVNNVSVVTSGDYQRFFESDGKRYHHLIDPVTLFPADYYKSVTVISDDSGICDALSTTLFLTDYDDAMSFISTLDNVEAIFVMKDDTVKMTDGMSQYLKQ